MREVKERQEGFAMRPQAKRPVCSNQMPPWTSRHEYQLTPGIWYRLRFRQCGGHGDRSADARRYDYPVVPNGR